MVVRHTKELVKFVLRLPSSSLSVDFTCIIYLHVLFGEEEYDQYMTKIQRSFLSLIFSLYVEKMTQMKIFTVNKEMNIVCPLI